MRERHDGRVCIGFELEHHVIGTSPRESLYVAGAWAMYVRDRTVALDGADWGLCSAMALAIVVAREAGKAWWRAVDRRSAFDLSPFRLSRFAAAA